MKYLSKILFACMLLCVSLAANAVDEVIITASPIPDYQTPMPTAGTFMGVAAQGTAQQAGQAAARQQCLAQVAKEVGAYCEKRSESIYQADLNSCSNKAIFGGVVGFGGGAGSGLALAALGTTPIGWGVAAISVIVGGGGTWLGLWGATTCQNSAGAANRYNLQTACPEGIKLAQDKTCPQI